MSATLRVLIGNQPTLGEQIEVESMDALALRLCERKFGRMTTASHETVETLVREARAAVGQVKFSGKFLLSECNPPFPSRNDPAPARSGNATQ